MNLETPFFAYQFFDRQLISEIELTLLQRLPGDTIISDTAIRLSIDMSPYSLFGEAVPEAQGQPTSIFYDEVRSIFVINEVAFVAIVSPDGLRIELRPRAGGEKAREALESTTLGDRLVTTVLSRIPILWGTPSIHGATLSWPQGSILLLGQSGVGKSTLSQHLIATHGAVLHDDDTSMVTLQGEELFPIPMGGAPRLRRDVANNLNLEGRFLPGYSGGKVALHRETPASNASPPPLVAVFEIVALEADAYFGAAPTPEQEMLEPVLSIPMLWNHIFSTNLEREQKASRFMRAHLMSKIPARRITYVRGAHEPASVARKIAECLG